MRRSRKKLTSLLTLICFLLTQGVFPPQAVGEIFNLSVSEVRVPTSGFQINLPPDLGTVQNVASGPGPTVVHIQTAHGNYEAQKKIQAILHYLKKNYGIKLLLLEGSAFKLRPEILRFFPREMDITMEIAEELARKALVKGPELFLLEDREAQALGIENLEAYHANAEAFKEVLTEQDKTQSFVQEMDLQIDRLTAPFLSPHLKTLLKRLEAFEQDRIPFLDWLSILKEEAKEVLSLDLTDPANQIDWPMMFRIFKLDEFEAKLDLNAFHQEREHFLKAIHRAPKEIYEEVKRLLSAPLSHHELPDPQTGLFFEKVASYLPEGFARNTYPNVQYFIGHLILQSELKAERLSKEIELLTERVLQHRAKTDEEKKILALLKDHRLLKKLFALELTPESYQILLDSSSRLAPSQIAHRFLELNQSKRVRDVAFAHLDSLNSLFEKALEFYRGVKERDRELLENIVARMREAGEERAVVITGGFHSGPFQEFFRAHGYNYALISPRITTTGGREAYVESILQRGTLESAFLSLLANEIDLHGFNSLWLIPRIIDVMNEVHVRRGLVKDVKELEARVNETEWANQYGGFELRIGTRTSKKGRKSLWVRIAPKNNSRVKIFIPLREIVEVIRRSRLGFDVTQTKIQELGQEDLAATPVQRSEVRARPEPEAALPSQSSIIDPSSALGMLSQALGIQLTVPAAAEKQGHWSYELVLSDADRKIIHEAVIPAYKQNGKPLRLVMVFRDKNPEALIADGLGWDQIPEDLRKNLGKKSGSFALAYKASPVLGIDQAAREREIMSFGDSVAWEPAAIAGVEYMNAKAAEDKIDTAGLEYGYYVLTRAKDPENRTLKISELIKDYSAIWSLEEKINNQRFAIIEHPVLQKLLAPFPTPAAFYGFDDRRFNEIYGYAARSEIRTGYPKSPGEKMPWARRAEVRSESERQMTEIREVDGRVSDYASFDVQTNKLDQLLPREGLLRSKGIEPLHPSLSSFPGRLVGHITQDVTNISTIIKPRTSLNSTGSLEDSQTVAYDTLANKPVIVKSDRETISLRNGSNMSDIVTGGRFLVKHEMNNLYDGLLYNKKPLFFGKTSRAEVRRPQPGWHSSVLAPLSARAEVRTSQEPAWETVTSQIQYPAKPHWIEDTPYKFYVLPLKEVGEFKRKELDRVTGSVLPEGGYFIIADEDKKPLAFGKSLIVETSEFEKVFRGRQELLNLHWKTIKEENREFENTIVIELIPGPASWNVPEGALGMAGVGIEKLNAGMNRLFIPKGIEDTAIRDIRFTSVPGEKGTYGVEIQYDKDALAQGPARAEVRRHILQSVARNASVSGTIGAVADGLRARSEVRNLEQAQDLIREGQQFEESNQPELAIEKYRQALAIYQAEAAKTPLRPIQVTIRNTARVLIGPLTQKINEVEESISVKRDEPAVRLARLLQLDGLTEGSTVYEDLTTARGAALEVLGVPEAERESLLARAREIARVLENRVLFPADATGIQNIVSFLGKLGLQPNESGVYQGPFDFDRAVDELERQIREHLERPAAPEGEAPAVTVALPTEVTPPSGPPSGPAPLPEAPAVPIPQPPAPVRIIDLGTVFLRSPEPFLAWGRRLEITDFIRAYEAIRLFKQDYRRKALHNALHDDHERALNDYEYGVEPSQKELGEVLGWSDPKIQKMREQIRNFGKNIQGRAFPEGEQPYPLLREVSRKSVKKEGLSSFDYDQIRTVLLPSIRLQLEVEVRMPERVESVDGKTMSQILDFFRQSRLAESRPWRLFYAALYAGTEASDVALWNFFTNFIAGMNVSGNHRVYNDEESQKIVFIYNQIIQFEAAWRAYELVYFGESLPLPLLEKIISDPNANFTRLMYQMRNFFAHPYFKSGAMMSAVAQLLNAAPDQATDAVRGFLQELNRLGDTINTDVVSGAFFEALGTYATAHRDEPVVRNQISAFVTGSFQYLQAQADSLRAANPTPAAYDRVLKDRIVYYLGDRFAQLLQRIESLERVVSRETQAFQRSIEEQLQSYFQTTEPAYHFIKLLAEEGVISLDQAILLALVASQEDLTQITDQDAFVRAMSQTQAGRERGWDEAQVRSLAEGFQFSGKLSTRIVRPIVAFIESGLEAWETSENVIAWFNYNEGRKLAGIVVGSPWFGQKVPAGRELNAQNQSEMLELVELAHRRGHLTAEERGVLNQLLTDSIALANQFRNLQDQDARRNAMRLIAQKLRQHYMDLAYKVDEYLVRLHPDFENLRLRIPETVPSSRALDRLASWINGQITSRDIQSFLYLKGISFQPEGTVVSAETAREETEAERSQREQIPGRNINSDILLFFEAGGTEINQWENFRQALASFIRGQYEIEEAEINTRLAGLHLDALNFAIHRAYQEMKPKGKVPLSVLLTKVHETQPQATETALDQRIHQLNLVLSIPIALDEEELIPLSISLRERVMESLTPRSILYQFLTAYFDLLEQRRGIPPATGGLFSKTKKLSGDNQENFSRLREEVNRMLRSNGFAPLDILPIAVKPVVIEIHNKIFDFQREHSGETISLGALTDLMRTAGVGQDQLVQVLAQHDQDFRAIARVDPSFAGNFELLQVEVMEYSEQKEREARERQGKMRQREAEKLAEAREYSRAEIASAAEVLKEIYFLDPRTAETATFDAYRQEVKTTLGANKLLEAALRQFGLNNTSLAVVWAFWKARGRMHDETKVVELSSLVSQMEATQPGPGTAIDEGEVLEILEKLNEIYGDPHFVTEGNAYILGEPDETDTGLGALFVDVAWHPAADYQDFLNRLRSTIKNRKLRVTPQEVEERLRWKLKFAQVEWQIIRAYRELHAEGSGEVSLAQIVAKLNEDPAVQLLAVETGLTLDAAYVGSRVTLINQLGVSRRIILSGQERATAPPPAQEILSIVAPDLYQDIGFTDQVPHTQQEIHQQYEHFITGYTRNSPHNIAATKAWRLLRKGNNIRMTINFVGGTSVTHHVGKVEYDQHYQRHIARRAEVRRPQPGWHSSVLAPLSARAEVRESTIRSGEDGPVLKNGRTGKQQLSTKLPLPRSQRMSRTLPNAPSLPLVGKEPKIKQTTAPNQQSRPKGESTGRNIRDVAGVFFDTSQRLPQPLPSAGSSAQSHFPESSQTHPSRLIKNPSHQTLTAKSHKRILMGAWKEVKKLLAYAAPTVMVKILSMVRWMKSRLASVKKPFLDVIGIESLAESSYLVNKYIKLLNIINRARARSSRAEVRNQEQTSGRVSSASRSNKIDRWLKERLTPPSKGIEPRHSLFGMESPGQRALDLVKRIYAADFWTDEERMRRLQEARATRRAEVRTGPRTSVAEQVKRIVTREVKTTFEGPRDKTLPLRFEEYGADVLVAALTELLGKTVYSERAGILPPVLESVLVSNLGEGRKITTPGFGDWMQATASEAGRVLIDSDWFERLVAQSPRGVYILLKALKEFQGEEIEEPLVAIVSKEGETEKAYKRIREALQKKDNDLAPLERFEALEFFNDHYGLLKKLVQVVVPQDVASYVEENDYGVATLVSSQKSFSQFPLGAQVFIDPRTVQKQDTLAVAFVIPALLRAAQLVRSIDDPRKQWEKLLQSLQELDIPGLKPARGAQGFVIELAEYIQRVVINEHLLETSA